MNRPAPKDLSTVPANHLAGYVIADMVRTLSLAQRRAQDTARAEALANLGGKKAA